MGALNVRANNIIENLGIKSVFEEPKVTNAKNLNVLKSQFRNSEKLSTKMFEDLSLVKQGYDFLISESIHGYMHFVGLFPFGFLLYMENQVSIIISNKLICFLRNLKVQNVDLYPSILYGFLMRLEMLLKKLKINRHRFFFLLLFMTVLIKK